MEIYSIEIHVARPRGSWHYDYLLLTMMRGVGDGGGDQVQHRSLVQLGTIGVDL